jgi:D-galacturonate reductase
MSYQQIKMVGIKGRIESDQKNRGINIVTDKKGVEDFNPYFSQIFGGLDCGQKEFSGYGCESIITFLQDVADLKSGKTNVRKLNESARPTFKSSLISTAVIEASRKSLKRNSNWINIDTKLLKKYIM